MRKIAYVANCPVPSRRASTVHVLNMSAAFAATGAAVTLFARGEPAEADRVFGDFSLGQRFDMRLVPSRLPRIWDRFGFTRILRRELTDGGFDFAYGRSAYGLLLGVPAEIPMALDLHAFAQTARQRLIEGALFRRPNLVFVTAITKALAEEYESAFPALRGRTVVAPCAANLPDAAMLSGGREPGPIRVFYVGHLYPGRGIDLIVELALQLPKIEFHIVGGEDADVASWAAQAPVNMTFHGYVTPSALAGHYRRADICVAPHGTKVAAAGGSLDIAPWMSPMKLFEYMSYGKALIATDLPVIHEVITPGVEGLVCLPGDVADWRQSVERLAGDPDLRVRLGNAARLRMERDYTWDKRASKIIARAEASAEAGSAGR